MLIKKYVSVTVSNIEYYLSLSERAFSSLFKECFYGKKKKKQTVSYRDIEFKFKRKKPC